MCGGLLIALAAPLQAQKNPPPSERPERLYRVGAGLAAGSAGLGFALDGTVHDARLYRFRLVAQDEAVLSWESSDERTTVIETAFLVGRGRRHALRYVSLAAGLALVQVIDNDNEDRTTIGVPLEAQMVGAGPLKLGATAAANLNFAQPYVAFILSLQLGAIPRW